MTSQVLLNPPPAPVGGGTRQTGGGSPGKKAMLRELIRMAQGKKYREVTDEVRALIEEYQALRKRIKEILRILREEYGYSPDAMPVRKGHGIYDYRGMPIYNAILEILKDRKLLTVEELEQELRNRGYAGLTGTARICLKNMMEDGLLKKSGNILEYTGGE